MTAKECNGDHGKNGMNGCIDPWLIEGKWICLTKMSRVLAKPLIELEQSLLDAHWDAGNLFGSWKKGEGE